MNDKQIEKLRAKLDAAVVASDGIAGKLAAMEAEAARLVAGRPEFVADILRAGDGADRSQLTAYNERLARLQVDVEGMRSLLDESFGRVESARAALAAVEDKAAAAVVAGHVAARDEALSECLSLLEQAGAALVVAGVEHGAANLARVARDESARFEQWHPHTLKVEAALRYFFDMAAGEFPVNLEQAAHLDRPTVRRVLQIESA